MSLKSTALKLGLAFAAAKGVQAFRDAGGLEGVKRKLSEKRGGGTPGDDPVSGVLARFGLSGAGRSAGIAGLLGGLAEASGGAAAGTRVEGLLARTRMAESMPDDEAEAGLIIRAMVMAAKADGEIDPAERRVIDQIVADGDPGDAAFLDRALDAPVDAEALAREVPKGQERDVYTASVMAIDPDNRAEAEHLDRLARALRLGAEEVNEIHESLGRTKLY